MVKFSIDAWKAGDGKALNQAHLSAVADYDALIKSKGFSHRTPDAFNAADRVAETRRALDEGIKQAQQAFIKPNWRT